MAGTPKYYKVFLAIQLGLGPGLRDDIVTQAKCAENEAH